MKDAATARTACPDEERLEAYALGRLPAAEAEEVEEHFIGCDACWGRVRAVLEVRAAFAGEGAAAEDEGGAPGGRPERPAAARSRRWVPALAAAALAAVALGGAWLWQAGPGGRAAPPLRGAGEGPVLEISLAGSGGGLSIGWEPVPGARAYRIEVADGGGAVVLVRETERPAVELTAEDLASADPPAAEVRVLALDELRQELAASPWRPIGRGGSEPGEPD